MCCHIRLQLVLCGVEIAVLMLFLMCLQVSNLIRQDVRGPHCAAALLPGPAVRLLLCLPDFLDQGWSRDCFREDGLYITLSHTFSHTLSHALSHILSHALSHTHSPHSLTPSHTHSLIHWPTHSLIHAFSHTHTQGLTNGAGDDAINQKVYEISGHISRGAQAFLTKEYQYISVFSVLFGILLTVVLGLLHNWGSALFTTIAFLLGGFTSCVAGYVGMRIAVYSNSRTALSARFGYGTAFITAFKAGAVMGFTLVALGLINLWLLITCYRFYWTEAFADREQTVLM